MVHSNYRNKILVVDDNQATLYLFKKILEEKFDLISASGGEEALQILKQQDPPDLILSDIMMPKMSGYALFHDLQKDPRLALIPVIFVTSLSSQSDELIGLETGAVDYITKPVERKTLIARINNILELCQYRRDLNARLPEIPGELFPDEPVELNELEEKDLPNSTPLVMVVDPRENSRQYQLIEQELSENYQLVHCAQQSDVKTYCDQNRRPDLILLDPDHAGENRFDLLREFKQEKLIQTIPVILLTAINCVEDETKAFESGCNDYIIKPIVPHILKARIRIHVELSRHHQKFEQKLELFMENEPPALETP